MKYATEFKILRIADIVPAPYNPREDILPGSPEYKKLKKSLTDHGVVEPPVVNLHNMRCIGGHQRLTVLRDMGVEEVLCSVVTQPDELQEKKLALALNKIEGRWDTDLLGALLRDDEVLEYETGFNKDEVMLYRQLADAKEPDTDDEEALLAQLGAGDEDADLDDYDDGYADEPGDEEEDDSLDDFTDSTTLVRVGHLHFKVEVSKYRRFLEAIRDRGIFDEKEIAAELKRRLLYND